MKLRNMMLIALSMVAVFLTACAKDAIPRPDSDSGQEFSFDSRIPVDEGYYNISGVVVSDIDSLVRQTEAARGSVSGTSTSTFGYVSGTYFGPEFGGKGFIRIEVIESNSYLAPTGSTVILKSSDTKAILLAPGDEVQFKCRHQYEAVAPVLDNEVLNTEEAETWEIDFCRLVTPIVRTTIVEENE